MKARLYTQRGFTIIELLVATTVGLLLMSGVMTIMYQSAGMAEVMRGQIVMNQQAREMFRILTDGGVGYDNIGSAGKAVAGLRGRKKGDPLLTAANLTSGYRMKISDGSNDVLSSRLIAHQVKCAAVGDPLGDCLAGGEIKSVDGYLAAAPTLIEPLDPAIPWAVMEVKLIDPRTVGSSFAGRGEATDSFYAIIGLNKEIAP